MAASSAASAAAAAAAAAANRHGSVQPRMVVTREAPVLLWLAAVAEEEAEPSKSQRHPDADRAMSRWNPVLVAVGAEEEVDYLLCPP